MVKLPINTQLWEFKKEMVGLISRGKKTEVIDLIVKWMRSSALENKGIADLCARYLTEINVPNERGRPNNIFGESVWEQQMFRLVGIYESKIRELEEEGLAAELKRQGFKNQDEFVTSLSANQLDWREVGKLRKAGLNAKLESEFPGGKKSGVRIWAGRECGIGESKANRMFAAYNKMEQEYEEASRMALSSEQ